MLYAIFHTLGAVSTAIYTVYAEHPQEFIMALEAAVQLGFKIKDFLFDPKPVASEFCNLEHISNFTEICTVQEYENVLFKNKCDYSPNYEFLQTSTTELTKTHITIFNGPLDFCFTNTTPVFFTCEPVQTNNSISNYLKDIAFFCNENSHFFLIAGLAVVVGYSLWRYFSLKTEQPDPQGPGTGEGLSILVDPTHPLPTSPIPVFTDDLEPERAHPPANPLDNTVETVEDTINIAIERVRDALPDELILDMLIQQIINQNEQHSFLREMFQYFRDFLGEIFRQIAEILIHLTPAIQNAVIALSHIPNIPS